MAKGSCKMESCEKPAVGKGYCASHYKAWRRGSLPKGRYKICTAEGCRKPRHSTSNGSKCEEHAKKAPAAAEAAPAS